LKIYHDLLDYDNLVANVPNEVLDYEEKYNQINEQIPKMVNKSTDVSHNKSFHYDKEKRNINNITNEANLIDGIIKKIDKIRRNDYLKENSNDWNDNLNKNLIIFQENKSHLLENDEDEKNLNSIQMLIDQYKNSIRLGFFNIMNKYFFLLIFI